MKKILLRILTSLLKFIGLCACVPLLIFGLFTLARAVSVYSPRDCGPFINDPALTIPFETTPATIIGWAGDVFTTTERWQEWRDDYLTVRWHGDGTEHRAFFNNQTNEFSHVLHEYWINEGLSGQQLVNCFGEPTFYQAYWEPNPHGEWLAIELVYPDKGLIFRGHQEPVPVLEWLSPNEWTNFGQVRHFAPVVHRDQIAPYLSGLYGDQSDALGWADVALHEWEGWNRIQIVTDETLVAGSPRAPATATAVAAQILAAPPFPTSADATSEACLDVLSPSLYNPGYGTATFDETRVLLQGLYAHLYDDTDARIEQGTQSYENLTHNILNWAGHDSERASYVRYTAYFQDDILQSAEGTFSGGAKLADFIECLGAPRHAIVTQGQTANGELLSLYLFFPAQGIATATYLFDGEIVSPHEQFPVMIVSQTTPQSDSAGLVREAFPTFDTETEVYWISDLQAWQGFEQLVISER